MFTVFTIVAIASMIAGNVLALLQDNVKRILAYSSIAHLGYILVAFQAAGQSGSEAVTFYLVAYFITTLGAFGIVAVLSTSAGDAEQLEDYRGLFWRRPAAGSGLHRDAFLAGRHPAHGRIHRQVLHCCCGRLSPHVGADHHSRGDERHRALLLLPHRRGAVRPAGRKPDRRVQALSGRRPGPCTFGRSLSVVWRLPGAIAEYDPKRASRVGLKGQTMFPLKKILLPIDFSERCLGGARYAIPLVEHFHSELTLLHVVSPIDYLSPEETHF